MSTEGGWIVNDGNAFFVSREPAEEALPGELARGEWCPACHDGRLPRSFAAFWVTTAGCPFGHGLLELWFGRWWVR